VSEISGGGRVRFGAFEADLRTRELWKFGIRIRLGGQPFEVLAILLGKPGELVTREELRERLWQGATYVGFDHGLNAAVNKLREALSDSVEDPRYVETLPRLGYRFITAVERVIASGEPRTSGVEAPVSSSISDAVEPAPAAESYPLLANRHVANPDVANPSLANNPVANNPEFAKGATENRVATKSGNWRLYFVAASVVLILSLIGTFFLRMASFGAHANKISAEARENDMANAHPTFAPVQRIRPLTSLAEETSEPAFSPDGNYVAFRRLAATAEGTGIFVKAIGSEQLVQLTRKFDDCCPVWSPDGRTIAFSRVTNNDIGIYVVSTVGVEEQPSANAPKAAMVTGTAERKLDTAGVNPRRPELAWSPDGKTLAFNGGSSIFLLSLDKSGVHRLTEPPPLAEDWGPAFSPDGQKVLFVRSQALGFPEEILSLLASGGEVTHIAAERARVLGPPQWSADGQSIIFASDQGSHPGLWRVSADLRDSPVQINDSGWYPAVSRRGYRLAYQRITRNLSIWQMDLSGPGKERKMLIPSTSETDQGPGPQISPDGTKLAYMSDRSGTMEIWVSDRDGKNPFQLTAVGAAGTPRWSPDGESIVFDATGRNGPSVYVMSLDGEAPRLIGANDSGKDAMCPSWSHDGKWIYFVSTRSGKFQVWKAPADGGAAMQVTKLGGHAPLESADGKYIYYAKTHYANPEIWQVPVSGGAEKLLSPLVRPASWASWAVVDRGIVFAGPSGKGRPVVELFDLATHDVKNLGELNIVPFWLGASRDGKSVVFDQPGWEQAQLMLVENFR
jgi:Tol biopolymer transport system component/DNA-binding winged helix-turn-helix (wHTH) protein